MLHVKFLPLALAAFTAATPLQSRDTVSSVVNLANNTGAPEHLAAGFIYGIPDRPNQIPDHFYINMGFNHGRAGGAQIPSPGLGWIWGLSEYKVRFASALSNYKTTREHNGKFIFLIHDLWGADGTQNATAPYPGDDGDWSSWDAYLTQFISDMNANDATTALSIDIWNEPDLTTFWNRSQAQWIQMYGRTYDRFRAAWPDVLLLGPTLAEQPDATNTWWTNYLSFIKTNASIPDQYVWHMETGGGDMQGAYGALYNMLETYSLPLRPLNIDEYATYAEEVPSGSAWWISQLERVDAIGLRGNWLSGLELHDLMGSLVSKTNAATDYNSTGTGYYPNGAYQVYEYYYRNMTGYRVGSLPSTDLKIDTYATVGADLVRVLTGVRITEGTWAVTIDSLSSVGLATSGSLNIHTWEFPGAGHFGEVNAPIDLGWYSHDYTGDTVTFPIYQTDNVTAYAFEFHVG